MPMRGRLLTGTAVAAVSVALAVSSTAGATAKAFVNLKAGDEIDVVGTGILCSVEKGTSGRLGVACYEATPTGLLPGSFSTGIGQDGRVFIGQANAKGTTMKVVFERTLAAAGIRTAAAKRVKGRVGQAFHVVGTPIDCAIVRSGAGAGVPTVYCSKDDKAGPVPGTYATLLSDQVAAVGKVDATRHTTSIVVKNQPKR